MVVWTSRAASNAMLTNRGETTALPVQTRFTTGSLLCVNSRKCIRFRKALQDVSATISGESRIIFLPERSSIYQYRPEISAMIVKKQSRTRLLFAQPLLYILKTQKMYCAFWK